MPAPILVWSATRHNAIIQKQKLDRFAHFLAGRYEKALECATTGIRKWPNFVALQRNAAACYAKSGRVEDAKRAWLVALQLDPTQRISNLRSQTLFRNEDFEKFAEAYRIMGMPE